MAEENENNKRGRGRPKNSPNLNPSVKRLSADRELVKKTTNKKIGLFVVKQMDKIEELYADLTPSAKAKLLIELMKYSTTTYAQEVQLKNTVKEEKKQISKIEISYEKPVELPSAPIEITPHEDVDIDSNEDAEDIDEIDFINDDEPF